MSSTQTDVPLTGGRREAVPIKQALKLTEGQLEVCRAIEQRIDEMAAAPAGGEARARRPDELPDAKRFGFLPTIDYQRSSRIMLIDGDRGSGKTSVLLTLLDRWSERLLDTPAKRIVPLRIIELSPLPESTSLLFLLVSSLRPIVTELERECGSDSTRTEETLVEDAPWQRRGSGELRSRRAWRQFVRTAATGWSRNMMERQVQLDPEAYALELEQAEDHRLKVVSDFRALVDAVVADLSVSPNFKGAMPLIVVPIDDADMNSDKLAELLELLRTLHHSRLVYLLTGWSQLFLDTLVPAQLQHLVAPLHAAGAPKEMVEPATDRARKLAYRIYDKTVAPDHRFLLTSLRPVERWERLKASLSMLDLKTDGEPPITNLGDFVGLSDTLFDALPSRMRDLVDFQAWVARAIERDRTGSHTDAPASSQGTPLLKPRAYAQIIQWLWSSAVDDAPLTPEKKQVAQEAIRSEEPSGRLVVIEKAATIGATLRPVFSPTSLPEVKDYILECSTVDHWHATLDGERLSSQACATFLLASIVALEGRDHAFLGPSDAWRNSGGYFALVSLPSPLGDGRLSFGWPLFDSRLVLDMLLFAKGWHRLAEEGLLPRPKEPNDVDVLARRFVGLLTLLAEDRRRMGHDALALPSNDKALRKLDEWSTLARRLRDLLEEQPKEESLDATGGRSSYIRQWIIERVGLMATPESGLPPRSSRAIISAFESGFASRWRREILPAVRHARRRRLQEVLDRSRPAPDSKRPSVEQILHTLDASARSHPWTSIERTHRSVIRQPKR